MSTDEYVPDEEQVRAWCREGTGDYPDVMDEWLDRFLARVRRDAKAEALRSAAEMIEDMRNGAEIAEVAAYVPGEVGRQNVIDSFEAVMDEPGDWLRSLADAEGADIYHDTEHPEETP